MAAGCPVVSTSVGWVPDLISDRETGLLVPARDPDRLAGALVWARAHPADTRRWSKTARKRVGDQHGVDGLVSAIDQLYRRLAFERSPLHRSA